MQKTKYVFLSLFCFNENTIKTSGWDTDKKWNITKAKTDCPFECPQVLTMNSLTVSAYKHTYALIEWNTIGAYNGLPPIRRGTII